MPKSRARAIIKAESPRFAEASGARGEKQSLERRVADIQAKGYAASTGLVNANFAAVAAPIYDYSGELAAVLTLLGPDKYLVDARLESGIKDTVEAAANISKRLGGKAAALQPAD
jgi:DNA-binding IclR family transcriptional regulator